MKTAKKSFYLIGSYKTHLPIKQMNKEAKAYAKRVSDIKKKEEIERNKIMIRCSIITSRDLMLTGAC